jgi:hypothetical protein
MKRWQWRLYCGTIGHFPRMNETPNQAGRVGKSLVSAACWKRMDTILGNSEGRGGSRLQIRRIRSKMHGNSRTHAAHTTCG